MPSRYRPLSGRHYRIAFRPLMVGLGCCALMLLCVGGLPESNGQEAASDVTPTENASAIRLRLRVYWDGGPDATAWSGEASIDGGSLAELRPWGGRADTPTIAIEQSGGVQISPGGPRSSGAFDVTAIGPPDGVLRVRLSSPGNEPVISDARLRDLASGAYQAKLAEGGVVRIYRAADDLLRVVSDREQFIFQPGESFAFEIDSTLAGFPPHTPIDLQAEVSAGRGGDPLETAVQRAAADADGSCRAPMTLSMPQGEGVYTVSLAARRPSGFMRGWGKGASKPLAERTFQVVVWDDSAATQLSDAATTVVEIDPTNSRWWMRMPEWKWTRRVPWLPKGPLGSEPAELVTEASGKWVRLAPADRPEERRWQAYPLPIDHPGAAHLLEIEVADGSAQTLDLSLFDRDAIGRAAPLGDSLTAVTGEGRGGGDGRVVVRRLFWPKTDSPMLVVSNPGGAPAFYGSVRVKSLSREPLVAQGRHAGERPLLASFTSGQLTKLVGATQTPAADGRYVFEDWRCFYDAAVRAADYVEQGGYNGATITVAAAEGVVYPTRVLGSQSGMDWQIVATGVVDTPRKDLLELLLREFDRRGLSLTLAVDFASAMPAVEAALAAGDPTPRLVDVDGRTPDDSLVQYNPLHPIVRRESVAAVAELAEHCRGHECFAGVAVRLSPRSHVALRGDLWGADARTVDEYLAAKRIGWPAETPRTPENVRRALAGDPKDPWREWREWRAMSMAALYGEMARAIAAVEPSANLYLLTDDLLDDAAGRRLLRPRLEQRLSLDVLLRERGVDRTLLAGPPNLVVSVPRYADLSDNLNLAALPMQQNALHWHDSASKLDDPHSVCTLLRGKRLDSLPGFKARSPFGSERTFTAATHQRVAFGRQAPAALTALVSDAPVGGLWEDCTCLSLADGAIPLRRLVRQTPADGSAASASPAQPLAGWTIASDEHVVLLVGNPSDWPLKATLTLDAPEASTGQRLTADAGEAMPLAKLEPGKHAWPLELPPHGVAAYRFDNPRVTIAGVRSETQPGALKTLSAEVDQLGLRDLNAKLRFAGCPNLSFEEVAADGLPTGWRRAGPAAAGTIAVSTDSAVDGKSSVSITAGGQPIKLSSAPFTPPDTRQLVMTFFVRVERHSEKSALTIRYLTGEPGEELFTTIAGDTLSKSDGWRQFVFAEDLPLGPARPMQIEFEARDLEVSIDKLELQSLSFPLDYELGGEARRQRLALVHVLQSAKTALGDSRVTDCQRTLDCYWAEFLQQHTPIVERKVEVAAEQQAPAEEEDEPKNARGWKSYLPSFLR
ncbi:hypothetical protein Pla123a_27090 [Posidoniimonas polymericola]|uniref:Glycosyl hydrolase-like 10 domain-containing protein n=1 Tax=Posidoniimonas polymericola TaxID=2528002 RepID=A0A5C5YLX8_9BACT|nr:hypothetical protein [Posidoniimonas polymericola]TWT75924.1 hypothetical protein Pla123a_27090 [Posidoniimonas polymericola]